MPKLYIRLKDSSTVPLDIVKLGEFDPIPEDGFCYVLGKDGLHDHLSNDVFDASAPTKGCPQLAAEPSAVRCKLPPLKQHVVGVIVGFFHQVYKAYRSEAIVLLYYSAQEGEYMLLVPQQEVDVWGEYQTQYGGKAWQQIDLKYEVPPTPPALLERGYKMVGTIHSHGNFSAYHSATDDFDEKDRNGLHITVGSINKAKAKQKTGKGVSFSCSFMVSGKRHMLKTAEAMEPFTEMREPPEHWFKRVKKGEPKPQGAVITYGYGGSYGSLGGGYEGNKGGGTGFQVVSGSLPPGAEEAEEYTCYGTYDGEDDQCQHCTDATDCLIQTHTEPAPESKGVDHA